MKLSKRKLLCAVATIASTLALVAAPTAVASPKDEPDMHGNKHKVCAAPTETEAGCTIELDSRPGGTPTGTSNTSPNGFGPAQFHGAYNVPTASVRSDMTIAVIVGYDNPNAKADLDVYNAAMGLPAFPSCSSTVTTACFQKVKQKSSISTNESWILESSEDVQTTHQMCQNCKILLVEATTSQISNLMWAVDTAVSMGAQVVNTSWGFTESSTTLSNDSHFNHPGVAFVASSGDNGYGSHWPAASQYVTAVGGTTLTIDGLNNWVSETAWASGGSGCSAYETKPVFQTDTGCLKRSYADVAADADYAASGAAIYDSFGINGNFYWLKVGGTSLAAPLVSGIYALGGVTPGLQQNSLPYLHGNATNLHDVLSGSNGSCGTYLCNAGIGYDGPTGLGTPNGVTAFQ